MKDSTNIVLVIVNDFIQERVHQCGRGDLPMWKRRLTTEDKIVGNSSVSLSLSQIKNKKVK